MNKNNSYNHIIITVVTSSLIGGFIGGIFAQQINPNEPLKIPDSELTQIKEKVYIEESKIIDTAEKVSPSVFSIVITKELPKFRQRSNPFDGFFNNNDPFNPFFFQPQPFEGNDQDVSTTPKKVGGGSGFIVTSEGLAVTNRHVVDDTDADYTAILSDGRELPLEIVSLDPLNDIAIVQIKEAKNLPAAKLGNSEALKIGQKVVAIGNALAEYGNTVTTGVISGKGRDIIAGSVNDSENLINLLQTDTAINPGNSGGPLVNLNGEVIGINVAIASGAEGIGFAIPIDDIKNIIESVKESGRIIRPFLGVRFMILNKNNAEALEIDIEKGALLIGNGEKGQFAVIPNGPADKADLRERDVILEVDGKPINENFDLRNSIANKKPGDTVNLKIWRNGKEIEAKITLEEAK